MSVAERGVVIADAGPLIGLARIGQLDLLPQLFGKVTVTSYVADEVLAGGAFADQALLQAAFAQDWLAVVPMDEWDPDVWRVLCRDLISLHQIDMGEASALVLAQQWRDVQAMSVLLLMDDHRGRQAARHYAIAAMGTAGLLVLAKQAGRIAAVKPLLLALRQAGYFLSDRLIEAVLLQASE